MSEKIDNPIIILGSIDSTNNYATNHLAKECWEEGTVVIADVQNKGKGQLQNTWESEKGKNLLISMVLYPRFIPVQNQFEISKVIALGVYEVVSLFVENVTIKWPNDIYVADKKIAGILIENAVMGSEYRYAVAGIGLNVNQQIFLSDAPNPVSLSQLKGIEFDREEILSLLIQSIQKWYKILKMKNYSEIDTAYLNVLYCLGIEAKYKDDNGIFNGTIVGIDPIGQLIIEKSSSEIRSYYFKEVAFLD
jgi:BirA family transcriptional regulator, biotin operon repressor / biotin---[acetyl-CoA-carboxylase] ligase